VRVPPALAMRWLLDAEGRVRAPFAADYELSGRALDAGRAARGAALSSGSGVPTP
jgi:hypothetical protein